MGGSVRDKRMLLGKYNSLVASANPRLKYGPNVRQKVKNT